MANNGSSAGQVVVAFALGVEAQDAIALGLLLYLLNLGVSLLGAPAFAVGGRIPSAEPAV